MEIVYETFSLESFIYCTNKFRIASNVEISIFFATKGTHSLAVLMILSATRSLLFSEFMMSLVTICKTAISVIASFPLKVGQI